MTPFKAMIGVDAFELDNEIGLQSRIDEDPGIGDELAKTLASLYQDLVGKGNKARYRAEKYYNKAIKEVVYDEGGRVLVYNPQADLEKGRKLSAPWTGPYVIEKKLSDVSYNLKTARVHVNRLRHLVMIIGRQESR